MSTPEIALSHLDAGDVQSSHAVIRSAFTAGAPRERTRDWAMAAEAAGLPLVALQAWQAVLASRRDDAEALERLAVLHEERGDGARARACRARLRDLGVRQAGEEAGPERGDEAPEPPAGEPGDGDLVRFVQLFAGREGVHARQWSDRQRGSGYSPVQGSLSSELVRTHLKGDVTLGIYVVRRDDTVGQLIFDLDATRAAVQAAEGDAARATDLRRRIHSGGLALLAGLRGAGFDPLLVDSGYKGRHLWCFFPTPEKAGRARDLGLAWAAALAPRDPELSIEVFPKQDRVAPDKLGNLVKIPLGVHQKTGRRCVLLDDDGQPLADPWDRLRQLRLVPLDVVRPPPPRLVPGGGGNRTGAPEADAVAEPLGPPDDPAVPPVPPDPPFTEADFEARPRLAAILAGCAVVREVVDRALADRRLDRDEHVVLEHVLGHLPEGVQAVNFLVAHVGLDPSERMGAPHSGNAVSCKGVRKRLPRLCGSVHCNCAFDVPEHYPSPLLHAHGLAAAAPDGSRSLPELLDAILRLEARRAEIDAQLAELRRAAARRVAGLPGERFETEQGAWRVEDVEGIPALRLVRDAG